MRLSDSDRERLYELLSEHAAAGRITTEELERRVALAVRAQTRAEASALLDDLPPLPGRAQTPWWRARAHGETDVPAVDWQPTSERFRDPRTKRIMRVWVDADGGRHYVPDESA
ncbi:MAG TPA: DUF1707 domain-containing protein [Solirubrobacteraceae bacterium]|nr:DUF1707 domain-containing protein [Solirubrobacteraceae bacterium]